MKKKKKKKKKERPQQADPDDWSGVDWTNPPKAMVDQLLSSYGVGARWVVKPAGPVSDEEYEDWS